MGKGVFLKTGSNGDGYYEISNKLLFDEQVTLVPNAAGIDVFSKRYPINTKSITLNIDMYQGDYRTILFIDNMNYTWTRYDDTMNKNVTYLGVFIEKLYEDLTGETFYNMRIQMEVLRDDDYWVYCDLVIEEGYILY